MRVGVLTPHAAPGPEVEFPEMLPGRILTRVARVSTGAAADAGASPGPPPSALRALATSSLMDQAVKTLVGDAVDGIGWASTTSAYAVGFDAERATISRLTQVAGVPVESTCASAVQALRTLAVERVALIGAPWFTPEFNALAAAYFGSQGFDVVLSASAALPQATAQTWAAAVCDWAAGNVGDDAEAIFIGGNGFRTAGAIERLEATLNRPVLTANQVLLWSLLGHVAEPLTISGYGRLFESRPVRG